MNARRNGEERYKETGKTFFQGLFFLSGLVIFLSLTSYVLSPVILKYFIHSPEIYKTAVDYLEWRCFGLLFSFPFLAFRAFFVGITKTRILSWAATLAVLINIPCDYLFIFSFNWGISGAAIASLLAEASSLLILVIYVFLQMNKENWGLRLVYDGKLLKSLFHLSVWSMMHAFISVAPWFLFFVAIERLGEVQLAVSNIIRSISTVFFVIVNSFAATTGSLVSNLIGAGEGKSMFWLCGKILRLGYAVGFPLIIIAMLLNKQIVGFYTDNVALIELAYYPFIVMLLNYTFALPGYVFMNAVTGTGNTRIAFIFQISTIAFYLFYLYLLSYSFTATLPVYLMAEYLFVILLGVQSYIYLKMKQHR